ncbi:MAG: cytochrome c [Bacteroidota bacterium]|nr:cytochrome c [Bacteroidota bacterium]
MKKIFFTVIFTLLLIAGVFVIYIYSGSYNISQLTPHNAFTKWIIETTKNKSINKRLKDLHAPPMTDTNMIIEGFKHYNEMCVNCHGGPGIDPGELAKGLYPNPPKFYKSQDMPDTIEAFWIIKNGIKMTGMPAFGLTHSDQKIWATTDFLLNKMNKMSAGEYQEWIKKYSNQDADSNH